MDFYPGAYSDYTVAWGDLCFPLPDSISFAEAGMADILCVGVHANDRAESRAGDSIVSIGGGPAGVAIAVVALVRGAETVFVSDPSEICRNVAAQYPGIITVDPTTAELSAVIREHGNENGVAAVFDTVGSAETFGEGLSLLQASGTYVNLAVHETQTQLDLAALGSERRVTTSSNAYNRDVVTAYELLFEGKVDVKPWLTHRFKLEAYAEAFELLLADEKQAFKAVLVPGE